jgi:hypothetical protein
MPVPNQRVRVLGSGFTVFHWNPGGGEADKVIGFAREVRVAGVTPVAQPSVIQPLNAPQPLEIVTPGAHTNGVLTLVLTDLYNQAVWQRLSALANSQDIVDIMRTVAARSQGIKITKWVKPPQGLQNEGFDPTPGNGYAETYFDCVIARVGEDETINIEAMEIHKEVEVWYTYSKKLWINGGARSHPLVYS